jgi:hypothetical protein
VLLTEPGRAALSVQVSPGSTIPVTIAARGGRRQAGIHPNQSAEEN